MFRFFSNNQASQTPDAPKQKTGELAVSSSGGPDISGFHLLTMPSKFLPKPPTGASSRARGVVIWILVILVLSALLLFASMLLIKRVRTNETSKVQTEITVPAIRNTNTQGHESRIIERDLGSCAFSPASAGYDQELTIDGYPVKGYTASYFCASGSLAIQVLKFQDETSLSGRITKLGSQYRIFRDTLVQDIADDQKILWGSGIYLVQVTSNSLSLEDTNVSVLLDEYLRYYPSERNLPWKIAAIVVLGSASERDAKRLSDIKKIQIALEFYKLDQSIYPEALDQTVDEEIKNYLPEIPTNPDPGGTPYRYSQKLGGGSYEIAFQLEEGSGGVPAGDVLARPQGIFPKNREIASLLPTSLDSDTDGLTDVEESLWGTNTLQFDTDQDTYADGKEVRDGYDPAIAGNARLESSPRVKNYLSSTALFSLLYPGAWTLNDQSDDQVELFSTDKKDFFGVYTEDASGAGSILDWYHNEFPASVDSDTPDSFGDESDPKLISISGAEGAVASPDGLSVYAKFRGKLYTIFYNPGIKESLDYQTTFQSFLKSFTFFENPTS